MRNKVPGSKVQGSGFYVQLIRWPMMLPDWMKKLEDFVIMPNTSPPLAGGVYGEGVLIG